MSAATVCVFRTWKTGGSAVDVCLQFTDAPSLLPGGGSDSACALLSATCL